MGPGVSRRVCRVLWTSPSRPDREAWSDGFGHTSRLDGGPMDQKETTDGAAVKVFPPGVPVATILLGEGLQRL